MPNYIQLVVNATPAARVAIEQFDISAARPVSGFGEGWHEQEYNAATGKRWRWLSDRGALLVGSASHDGSAIGDVELRLEGESPLRYFSRGSRLIVRAGTSVDTRAGQAGTTADTGAAATGIGSRSRVVFDQVLSSDFSLAIRIPNPTDVILLETDQTYVPAERSWRPTHDRRRLGLRIFRCELRPLP
jgi:hypothetical protein